MRSYIVKSTGADADADAKTKAVLIETSIRFRHIRWAGTSTRRCLVFLKLKR